jgi:hypothetical protein
LLFNKHHFSLLSLSPVFPHVLTIGISEKNAGLSLLLSLGLVRKNKKENREIGETGKKKLVINEVTLFYVSGDFEIKGA